MNLLEKHVSVQVFFEFLKKMSWPVFCKLPFWHLHLHLHASCRPRVRKVTSFELSSVCAHSQAPHRLAMDCGLLLHFAADLHSQPVNHDTGTSHKVRPRGPPEGEAREAWMGKGSQTRPTKRSRITTRDTTVAAEEPRAATARGVWCVHWCL